MKKPDSTTLLHRLAVGLFLSMVGWLALSFAAPAAGAMGPEPASLRAGTIVCGDIDSDTRWSADGSPYLVTCSSEVAPGARLTIAPGVTVQFGGTSLFVQGSLQAVGTEAQPILFTSAESPPSPGDWGLLSFLGSHGSSLIQHAVVEYGGFWGSSIQVEAGSLILADSVVRHSGGTGLLAWVMPTVERTTFEGNAETAMELVLDEDTPQPGRIAGNQGTSNGLDGIRVAGTFAADATLGCNPGLPYFSFEPGVAVAAGSTLTLTTGAVIKFDGTKFIVNGALRAMGEPGAPVVFTSFGDDGYGGDTNRDGVSTTPLPGDWRGIMVSESGGGWTPRFLTYLPLVTSDGTQSPGSAPVPRALPALRRVPSAREPSSILLDHALVRYAGSDMANVEVYGGQAWIRSTTIEYSANKGLHFEDTSPEIRDSTIAHNATTGLWLYSRTVPSAPVIVDNQLVENGTYAAYLILDAGCHPATEMHGNGGSGNGKVNGIYVEGFVHTPLGCRLQPNPQFPYVLWAIIVSEAGRLQLDPGVQVKLVGPDLARGTGTLIISGTLEAVATPEAPIAFTSFWDDSIGGDTDGTPDPPAPGDWIGLLARFGAQVHLDHAVVRYGGANGANLYVEDASLELADSTLSFGAEHGLSLKQTTPGRSVSVAGNNFTANLGYAVTLRSQAPLLTGFDFSGNNGSGNGTNGILMDATLGTVYLHSNPTLPYVIQTVTVAAGETTTLEPGVVFKADGELSGGGSLLQVDGVLQANATEDRPVYFTSLHDDGMGGDTDGVEQTPAPGDWIGIVVSPGARANLEYAQIWYAGSHGSALSATDASLWLARSVIASSADKGLQIVRNAPSSVLDVLDSNFEGNGGYAITLRAESLPLSNFAFSGNVGSGNGTNGIQLDGPLDSVTVRANPTLPYVIQSLTVPAGESVAVEPGTVFKANRELSDGGSLLAVEGTLHATGTAGAPVVFTSLFDDSAGGDTDGTPTSPVPGDWFGIVVRDTGQASFDYTQIRYGGSEGSSLHSTGTTLRLTNCEIAHGAGTGLAVLGRSSSALVVRNSTFAGNGGYAATLRAESSALGEFQFSGNSGYENGINGILLDGSLGTATLPANTMLPYVIQSLILPAGSTLTVQPGVVFKADKEQSGGGSLFTVEGSLRADASGSDPVVLTSLHDDSVGGDTDGASVQPAPGDWMGLSVLAGGQVYLRNAGIRYAGSEGASLGAHEASLQLAECEIAYSADRGLVALAEAQPLSLVMQGCTFTGNIGPAAIVRTQSPALALLELSANGGEGNGLNGILLDVALGPSTLGANPWLPYLIESVEVAAGKTVAVQPGAVFKAHRTDIGGSSILTVGGTLNVQGTAASPVYFTSLHDDTVGGDSDGVSGSPAPGDWRRIQISPGGEATLRYAVVRYAAPEGAAVSNSGELEVEYSAIAFNLAHGIGNAIEGQLSLIGSVVSDNGAIGLANLGSAFLTHNDIMNNGAYGVYSTVPLAAEWNYWGSPDGPGWDGSPQCNPPPPGQGDWVTCTTVDYEPFSTVPYH